jgi:hypothetical protein
LAVESQPRSNPSDTVRRRRRRRRRWWSPLWLWRHRSSRRRRKRFDVRGRERRERLRLAAWLVTAVVVVGGILAALGLKDALGARSQLVAARASLQHAVDDPTALRSADGRSATLAEVDGAVAAIDAARRRVRRSPAITATAVLPLLRTQRAGMLDLIDDSATAAAAGRNLLASLNALADRSQLRDGTVPLDGLAQVQEQIRAAGDALGRLPARNAALWGPLGDARRQFDAVTRSSSRRLVNGAEALGAARTFMGAGGPRRYVVALQNNAEMRDQGMALSYVPLSFKDGRLTFEKGGSTNDLQLDRPAPTAVPEGTAEVFGSTQPTQRWPSVNATADFAFSGRAMVDMYRQATGQSADGVVAVDVPGLAALLRVVGPVTIEGGAEPITADNVARVLLHDFYVGLPNVGAGAEQAARKERLGDVLRVVGDRLTTGTRDAVTLGRELAGAASGGHLRLWSGVADEEGVFERTGLGGGPATADADRTFHVAVENRTASKVDYYLRPTVRQEVTLTPQGSAVVRTRVVVDNQAPLGQPPSYQLGPSDEFIKRPGDYLAWVLVWGPVGSSQGDGGVPESGLNLSQRTILVGAGERPELVFDTVIPNAVRNGELRLRLVPQARLDPVGLQVTVDGGRWKVDGARSWQGPWDGVKTLTWKVHR